MRAFTIKILGIEIASFQLTASPIPVNNLYYMIAPTGEVLQFDPTAEVPVEEVPVEPTGQMISEPILTEHGYAYSCTWCKELLLEGLDEPIAGADIIELEMQHQCEGKTYARAEAAS